MVRVLVVDDEPDVRELVQALLGNGYDVLVATDASTALSRLHEERFDLVVLDYLMPEVGGELLGPLIRRIHPDVKILGFSALHTGFAMGAGRWADAYLGKTDAARLPKSVARLLAA